MRRAATKLTTATKLTRRRLSMNVLRELAPDPPGLHLMSGSRPSTSRRHDAPLLDVPPLPPRASPPLQDAHSPPVVAPAPPVDANPLLESRLQQLVPGLRHANRRILIGGIRPDESAVLMNRNDYLRLTGHPAVAAAKANAMRSSSWDIGISLAAPDAPDRRRGFERRMAALLSAQDAVLTMSGAHSVRGVLEMVTGGGGAATAATTPIYADAMSWTARLGQLSGVSTFAHNDVDALHGLASGQPGVIVLDGVYNNGAVARVREVVGVAEATGSVLLVDETHSFGCAAGGLGVCDEAGVADRVHFRCVGLSKAFASRGGIVVGPQRALEAFRFVDGSLIGSTAPLEHEIVGYDATLDVLLSDTDGRRERLYANHARLKEGLLSLGYHDDVARSDRQILSVVTGDAARTIAFRDFCAARGVFGSVFCPPAAFEGRSYVRFTVHSAMSDADCSRFLAVMDEARALWSPPTTQGDALQSSFPV